MAVGARILSWCVLTSIAGLACCASAGAAAYPASPFAIGGPGVLFEDSGSDFWLGRPGLLQKLEDRVDGSLGVIGSIALPPGSVPVARASHVDVEFVLDRAHERLLVYETGVLPRLLRALAVGPQPTALAVGCTRCDAAPVNFVAVANSGSGDLSVYTWNEAARVKPPSFSAQRRVPVGGQPQALTHASQSSYDDPSLFVAGGRAGTVTVVDPRRDFARTAQVDVGGDVTAIWPAEFGARSERQLLVSDASAPRVAVLQRTPAGLSPLPPLSLPDPRGTANAVVVADVTNDGRPDVIVADRSTQSLVVFDGQGGLRFLPPRTMARGIDAGSMITGDFGGDWASRDLAVVDALTANIVRFLSPGDPLVAASAGAENLSSDRGVLAWSHPEAGGHHRLAVRRRGVASDVPIQPSTRPLTPHVGRLGPGRPVVAYVACRATRCVPLLWDIDARRERRLRIEVAAGCRVAAVAVWDDDMAFEVRGTCRRAMRGVWLRSGRHRPIRRGAGRLRDLADGYAVWQAPWPRADGQQVRVARPGGRARTIDWVGADCDCVLEPAMDISHGHVVYAISSSERDDAGISLYRLKLGRRGSCLHAFRSSATRSTIPGVAGPWDYTVDGTEVIYADNLPFGRAFGTRGIFRVDRERVRWRRDCSIRW